MSTDAIPLPDDLAACHALIGQFSATVESQQRELDQLKHCNRLINHIWTGRVG